MKKDTTNQGRRSFLLKTGLAAAGASLMPVPSTASSRPGPKSKNAFEFVFMTDIHIKPEMNAPKGFQMAIDKANEMNPDFVITGGDLVYDVMRGNFEKSDSLFKLYADMAKGFKMPVYNCIGNHDLFGIYEESPEDESHPDYKYGMWERYFGDTYYAFDHKGWHFITLNSLDVTDNKRYKGHFHQEQLKWLRNHLKNVDPKTPIVVTTHIPMLCTFSQLNGKEGTRTVKNAAEVFEIFEGHNLKLVLQGHIHWKEYGFVNDRVHFLTGGSIAGNGWKGRRHNTKEGFVRIKVDGDEFSWDYIDHGWERERLKMGVGSADD
ncbi:metallophosphoesterase family protein [Pseudozobellia thermophila]|uniref:3',5'-cyclic AMP phosphodiesterase CpdA n=1 Tax=Pseudozobellia thermophila TaxID=192903 RepID=A0A1M6I4L8_9FLAO|nr:metallophosphoesterase [Pseudozobellia thermophila]SHJ29369.1 3',5'-cyclic AMP phosphodiesterase CpdA [Pseudozobellia thermophila]